MATVKKSSRQQLQKGGNGMQAISSILDNYILQDSGGRITREFQDYGYRLAMDLDDPSHVSLYIKMAKEINRVILEEARSFVLDAHANNKARLFMWKVKQLRSKGKRKSV